MSKALLKSTGVVSAMTFLSRILGLVRDMVYAQAFGAGAGTDAFFVAFKIPNFLRRLFAEGAFSQAFVPVFSQYQSQADRQTLKALVDQVAGTLGGVLLGLTLLGVLGAPLLVWVFAPGFGDDPAKQALTTGMLRITFPYLLFISLTALAGGILNSCGRFAVPALTPVLLNICMISAALGVAPLLEIPVMALAWGVFAAGLVQLGFQVPFLYRLGLLPRPRWGWRAPGVQKVLRLMVPALFGSSVAQLNLLLDTLLASFLVTGSVSWLYYSDRLVEFPLGVFGVALGTVILPSLSREHAAASPERFARTLDWALRWVLLIGLPATLGLAMLAEPLLITLFQYGEFGATDVHQASRSLVAYSVGLLPFMLIKILAPGFYARQDTATPVRVGVIAMVANMGFNLALIVPLQHVGLALATTLSAALNAGLLFYLLHRHGIYRPGAGWWGFLARVIGANLAMAATLYTTTAGLPVWLEAGLLMRVQDLALLVGLGAGVYGLAGLTLGIRPRHLRL